jgi:hypothetical protein
VTPRRRSGTLKLLEWAPALSLSHQAHSGSVLERVIAVTLAMDDALLLLWLSKLLSLLRLSRLLLLLWLSKLLPPLWLSRVLLLLRLSRLLLLLQLNSLLWLAWGISGYVPTTQR